MVNSRRFLIVLFQGPPDLPAPLHRPRVFQREAGRHPGTHPQVLSLPRVPRQARGQVQDAFRPFQHRASSAKHFCPAGGELCFFQLHCLYCSTHSRPFRQVPTDASFRDSVKLLFDSFNQLVCQRSPQVRPAQLVFLRNVGSVLPHLLSLVPAVEVADLASLV